MPFKDADIQALVCYPSSTKSPTEPSTTRRVSSAQATALAKFINMPSILFHHITLAFTNAVENAPPALADTDAGFPVVVFSHGLGGVPHIYRSVIEEWASHGFIIVCPTHNDGSAAVGVTSDGQGVPHSFLTDAEKSDDKLMTKKRQKQLKQRVSETLATLEALGSDRNRWGKMDLDNVVLAGHSFGAATAITALAELHQKGDSCVKACILQDLWHRPLAEDFATQKTIPCPVLSVASGAWLQYDDHTAKVLARCHPLSKSLALPDTAHHNFEDVPLFGKLLAKKMGKVGSQDLRSVLQVISSVGVSFANEYTKDGENGLEVAVNASDRKSVV